MKRFQQNLSQVLPTLQFWNEPKFLLALGPQIIEIEDNDEEEESTLGAEDTDTIISDVAATNKGKKGSYRRF